MTCLEKYFNREEGRFSELHRTLGVFQSENLYPSIVGFDRSLFYILVKMILPVPFAAILVFVDCTWIGATSVLVLFFG